MAHLTGETRARYVATMFGRISRRYDLLNTVMSAGRHHAWRRLAARMAADALTGDALDIATGTGDFAIELARQPSVQRVVGLDFTQEMLPIARRKTRRKGLVGPVDYMLGDAHALAFATNSFACATVGFGVRNFIDVAQALREMARVVRPGGRVAILEIVRPEGSGPVSRLFPIYFRRVTPWMGAVLAGDREAYTYLPESVQAFLSSSELASEMMEAGIREVTIRELALGTVAIIVGQVGG